ncbi:hypothetical protein [Mesorhizobium sp.]|uniref:hypothetical protein n=1 Tax=Mesorhizobium sp. TaxID=1871066 RepID=UPI000FE46EC6|nr:hypothetical protein [Mesorhizobium sp.]RWC53041.1 MAG: hypothetical protein EOS56_31240 [Mesorhizobium sp.]RWC53569.1 MAG: hypothetical protein EOS29_29640 [Mesorhizobium sp.]
MPRRAPASHEVAQVIELMLASSDEDQIKSGLQRACDVIESGQAFLNTTFLTAGLHAHLMSSGIKVRRWAYKLVALLRDSTFLPQLKNALSGTETDPENRTWAAAAFFGMASVTEQNSLIARLDDSYRGTSLELASKLYARGEPSRDALDLRVWEKEPLARKWLCLLCGYAPTYERTIDRRFADLDLVRNSVQDSDPEIVEYSIWAEHKHPLGSYEHIRRSIEELVGEPNVRRWVYRLLTKDERSATAHLDLLTDAMDATSEVSVVAREGLALGIAKLYLPDRQRETIDWFHAEPTLRVRLALVDHLALLANKYDDAVARDVLTAAYHRLGAADLLSLKIVSVSKPEWELRSRSGMALTDLIPTTKPQIKSTLFQQPTQHTINIRAENFIMGNSINQSGSGNSVSGNAMGDMFQSSIQALSNQANQNFSELGPDIERFLQALEKVDIDNSDKQTAITAAKEVAEAPNKDIKKSKLATLKSVARGLLSVPGASAKFIEESGHLIDVITKAIS